VQKHMQITTPKKTLPDQEHIGTGYHGSPAFARLRRVFDFMARILYEEGACHDFVPQDVIQHAQESVVLLQFQTSFIERAFR